VSDVTSARRRRSRNSAGAQPSAQKSVKPTRPVFNHPSSVEWHDVIGRAVVFLVVVVMTTSNFAPPGTRVTVSVYD